MRKIIAVDKFVEGFCSITESLKSHYNVLEFEYFDEIIDGLRRKPDCIISKRRKESLDIVMDNAIIDPTDKTNEKIMKEANWITSDFGRECKMEDNIFFTSDTHFNHKNIIKYCNRPWNSGVSQIDGELLISDTDIMKMNEDLIRNWNSVVGKDDVVWHLGDFCLGKNQKDVIPEIVSRLNGKINIVLGNHDHNSVEFYYKAGFNRVYDRKVIISDYIILSHAPVEFLSPNDCFYNIYGHVHNSEAYETYTKKSRCVCVERHDYKPVSWKTIREEHENKFGGL